jgi:hypothetical protein
MALSMQDGYRTGSPKVFQLPRVILHIRIRVGNDGAMPLGGSRAGDEYEDSNAKQPSRRSAEPLLDGPFLCQRSLFAIRLPGVAGGWNPNRFSAAGGRTSQKAAR